MNAVFMPGATLYNENETRNDEQHMAEPLSIDNFNSTSILDRSLLAAAVDAGADSVQLQQAENVPTHTFALIGLPGTELAELLGIDSVVNNTLNLMGQLEVAHDILTFVSILQADRYRIYRATNENGYQPDDSAFTLLDEIDLKTDAPQTPYVDPDGGAGYWYKYTSYNSLTEAETSLGDALAVRGGGVGFYATLDDIRTEAGLENAQNFPDAIISRYRRRAQGEIDSKLGGTYIVPFEVVPEAIKSITELIAAGWLLIKEYGELDDTSTKSGAAKLAEGRGWLKDIVSGAATLPDVPVIEAEREEGVDGWPNDTTATADPDHGGGRPNFLIGRDF